MLPDPEICSKARLARDPRFDGRFFIAVLTTGVYCRPVCPARLPAEENVRYYPTPAAAQVAGFRPCLRCRPETARRLPEWTVGSQTVVRGLRLIDGGFLDSHTVEDLAAELGMTTRHLNRLFTGELQATPKNLARARRMQLAKRLIDDSALPLAQVALHAGFGSVRRFNHEVRAIFGAPPRELRRRGRAAVADGIQLQLPVRNPYHADWVFEFLERRSLPGLEAVSGHTYRRRLFNAGRAVGALEVRWDGESLQVVLPSAGMGRLGDLLTRVRRMFDLDADPLAIEAQLRDDAMLARQIEQDPGLRVPGAWDGFEIAVRGVLGQQVSVARARSLAISLCETFGGGDFPSAAQLADADVAAIGMPGKRAEAVRALARAVLDGSLILDETAEAGPLREALERLPGIGPWTAGYIGMRVARDPDGYPDADWVVLKMLNETAARARRRAEAWRPWRAYAVMVLWRMSALQRAGKTTAAGKSKTRVQAGEATS